MSEKIVLRTDAFRQFERPAETFCLVTDSDLVDHFELVGGGADDGQAHRKTLVVPVGAGEDVGEILGGELPESADVLVVCRRSFITSPDPDRIGPGRRLVFLPCASTPVTVEQIGYFLRVVQRTDPAAHADRADRFFTAVENAGHLRLVDAGGGTSCAFDPLGGDYEWNQQAGPLGPGEQQIAPAGELSVLPMEITDFDQTRRLALHGSLTVRGWPIVHAGYDDRLAAPQADLYARLSPLVRHPVTLLVDDGVITDCRPGSASPQSADLAATLDRLFADDPRYRTIWELGFGINPDLVPVAANCGLNEPYGGGNGAVHLGLGLTPFTTFALTFICPATAVVDDSDSVLLGPAPRAEPRIRRVRGASCACYPGGDPGRTPQT